MKVKNYIRMMIIFLGLLSISVFGCGDGENSVGTPGLDVGNSGAFIEVDLIGPDETSNVDGVQSWCDPDYE